MNLEKIKKYLTSKIKIDSIKIYDDSLLHNSSEKNLTHLRMIIVSDNFINKSLINRHRLIFSIISEIEEKKIYSVTLHTYTFNEWNHKKNKKITISRCIKK